jgi:hypothetical protein
MFEPEKCRQPQYKVINRFSINNMKWDNETFLSEKYGNFHGCSLNVGVYSDPKNAQKTLNTSTTDKVVNIFAESLKFHPNFTLVNSNPFENPVFDLFNVVEYQDSGSFKYHDYSPALYSDYLTLTVPAGEPYTQLEKMFLMFDKATWICIGATLAGTLLVIQVINYMSVQVQNFVFGRDIRSPMLNVANVFLNGGQMRVPGRNFARFMLMMFIIWSLIIRTCYQSILYQHLQQDLRKPRITNFEELNDKNFTIVITNYTYTLLGEEFVKR